MLQTLLLSLTLAAGEGPFLPPVQLECAGPDDCARWVGAGVTLPSPAVFDVDKDGTGDLVIGSLRGEVLWSRRSPSGLALERPLHGSDGNALKFHNW